MIYDETEAGASSEMSYETIAAQTQIERFALRAESEDSLRRRGDLVRQNTIGLLAKYVDCAHQGRLAGSNPAAPTIIPIAEFRKTSVICERCLKRRTRWLFSRSGFLKWRRCFDCMNEFERIAVAMFTQQEGKERW